MNISAIEGLPGITRKCIVPSGMARSRLTVMVLLRSQESSRASSTSGMTREDTPAARKSARSPPQLPRGEHHNRDRRGQLALARSGRIGGRGLPALAGREPANVVEHANGLEAGEHVRNAFRRQLIAGIRDVKVQVRARGTTAGVAAQAEDISGREARAGLDADAAVLQVLVERGSSASEIEGDVVPADVFERD